MAKHREIAFVGKWRNRVAPDEIVLPGPEDFCRGRMNWGRRRCTYGWLGDIFLGNPKLGIRLCNMNTWVHAEFVRIAREKGARSTDGIISINDDPRNSTQLLAEIFEEAMASLGYTEISYVRE